MPADKYKQSAAIAAIAGAVEMIAAVAADLLCIGRRSLLTRSLGRCPILGRAVFGSTAPNYY